MKFCTKTVVQLMFDTKFTVSQQLKTLRWMKSLRLCTIRLMFTRSIELFM
jgi:hypothetical protein